MSENIAGVIKSTRQSRSMSVYALSKITGVSTSHLYAIESRKKSPSLEVLEKILSPLGLRLVVVSR